jgi:hypothetical protein
MPFVAGDNLKIRRYLSLPPSERVTVQAQMDAITDEESITEIQHTLSQLDTIDVSLATSINTNAIKRVDTIEFFEGAKSMALSQRKSALSRYLSMLLGIIATQPYSGTTLIRS